MTKEILEILDNVRYWETCPDNYKETIEKFLTDNNQALQLQQGGVSGSTFIAVSEENNQAYLFDKSEMYLWENDKTVDIYEAKYYR